MWSSRIVSLILCFLVVYLSDDDGEIQDYDEERGDFGSGAYRPHLLSVGRAEGYFDFSFRSACKV